MKYCFLIAKYPFELQQDTDILPFLKLNLQIVSKKAFEKPLLVLFSSSLASRASEGRTVEVPYRGDVENTVRDVLGGLRSTCTYVGAAKLKELSRRTTFIRVTQQSSQMFT